MHQDSICAIGMRSRRTICVAYRTIRHVQGLPGEGARSHPSTLLSESWIPVVASEFLRLVLALRNSGRLSGRAFLIPLNAEPN